jgi:adenosylcobyric acid synthase
VGVIPYFQGFRVQEEDGVARETISTQMVDGDKIDIAVIQLPHISNFTDFDALEDEADVQLRYVAKGAPIGNPDLIILPGTKNTIEDLIYLQEKGYAQEIIKKAKEGTPIIGICGGFQMLGSQLWDPEHTESAVERVDGLDLIPMETIFEKEKITSQVEAAYLGDSPLLRGLEITDATGYEIHMGRTTLLEGARSAFRITKRSMEDVDVLDGALSLDGNVLGTYIHGIFDNDGLRRNLINNLRLKKGLKPLPHGLSLKQERDRNFDLLAQVVRESLNIPLIYDIMGLKKA